jgi:ferredoxin
MEKMIILKEKIGELVEKALKEYDVVAPVDCEGVVLFKKITDPSEMMLEASNTNLPAKAVLFEQTETLFTFSQNPPVTVHSPEERKKMVVVGIRPCDAQGLAVLDHVFAGEYQDSYVDKRENTVLIGLTCQSPGVTCFCTSVGGSPFSGAYTDVQLTDIGESFMVEVGTDKGTHFVESMGDVFEPATDEDIKKGEDIKTQAEKAIQQHMNTEDIVERLEGIFESPFWKNVAAKCLGCAACTYVCPTCHCFDMQDETAGGEGARIRVWDSCMYPEYTQHASGHNPRPARMNRIRNRVYHKFSYYPKNWSMLGCVGCGRCIEACPVNIDIIDVVNTTSEVNP